MEADYFGIGNQLKANAKGIAVRLDEYDEKRGLVTRASSLVSQSATSAREFAVRGGSAVLSRRVPPGPLGVLVVNVRMQPLRAAAQSLRLMGRR